MALLEFSEVLLDPMVTDTFSVNRRRETVGTNGRTVINKVFTPRVIGVVTMASGRDLERLPDEQHFDRVISIVTNFKLQGEVKGNQPDLIVWRGDPYVVKAIDYYPQFGAGFIQAICGSIDLVNTSLNPFELTFNQSQNSAFLGAIQC